MGLVHEKSYNNHIIIISTVHNIGMDHKWHSSYKQKELIQCFYFWFTRLISWFLWPVNRSLIGSMFHVTTENFLFFFFFFKYLLLLLFFCFVLDPLLSLELCFAGMDFWWFVKIDLMNIVFVAFDLARAGGGRVEGYI